MDYNSRMSQQFRASQQQQGRTKKKEDDPDAFMRLASSHLAYKVLDKLTSPAVRQRDRRMHQRYWRSIYASGFAETKPSTYPTHF